MHHLSAKTYQLKPKLIGVDASRAFLRQRTGIEEYSYQVIKQLRDALPKEAEVVLYVRKKFAIRQWKVTLRTPEIDFVLPMGWAVKGIWAPRFWTQIGLSIEMLLHRPSVLFIPAHTVPLIHPKRTVVTVHGLEYEFCPESYSWWERFYMRWSIRFSVRAASRVIAVSENTKRDLVRLYRVPEEKITVIYEGAGNNFKFQISNFKINSNNQTSQALPVTSYQLPVTREQHRAQTSRVAGHGSLVTSPYFLFVGRLEERKNVGRIIEAFEIFKNKTGLPHRLVLAGKPGFGYQKIREQLSKSKYQPAIAELGYISEEEKWALLKKAEALVFPSLYEGFGLPVLEAQMVGTPVITSTTSSLPEIAGGGAFFVDPTRSKQLARAMITLTADPVRRAGIIDEATRNVDRFSWANCAEKITRLLQC